MRRMDKQEFYEEMRCSASGTGSRYRDNQNGHEKVLRMAEANGWFQEDGTIIVTDREDYTYKTRLWLESYGLKQEEKLALLFKAGRERYPETCEAYQAFFKNEPGKRLLDRLAVMDFVLSEIKKEIMQYTEEELQPVIARTKDFLTTEQTRLFLASLYSMERYGLHLAYRYEPGLRQSVHPRNDAYSAYDYAKMAYYVFNEDSWKEKNTLEAAAGAKRYASVWLFTALHFVCAIRAKDMAALPAPDLWQEPDTVRSSILAGRFSGREAQNLCSEWLFKIDAMGKMPGKTARYGVPDIKVMIPATLREPFGVILGLAASWYREGEPFITDRAEARSVTVLFGKEFRETAGKLRFQTRRANKAFLQGLESVPGEGKIQGYMLAALARSHKGGIGTLADTTMAYLKDENFTGYTPEFIAREMFERGIFGFVPVLMLEAYRKEDFRALGVRRQTELIRWIGMEPVYLEGIARTVSDAMERARKAVGDLFAAEEDAEALGKAIQKVASGMAPAKQEEILCVRAACGMGCHAPDRASCIGCGCEIYTQGILHVLLDEYRELLNKKKAAEAPEARRIGNLILAGVLPVIGQFLTTIQELYPDMDTGVYLDEMERGMAYAEILSTGSEG